jgi:hypothetical protein
MVDSIGSMKGASEDRQAYKSACFCVGESRLQSEPGGADWERGGGFCQPTAFGSTLHPRTINLHQKRFINVITSEN